MSARDRRLEMTACRPAHVRAQAEPSRFRERLITHPRLDGNVFDFRRHVFRQVIQSDGIQRGLGISRVQHGFPLGIARGRNSHRRILGEIHLLPRTPVAVGIVDVAAAGQQLHVAGAAKLGPAPPRKNFGIEHIALVRAFALRTRAQEKNLP